MTALEKLGITRKLTRLKGITVQESKISKITQTGETIRVVIDKTVRKGDASAEIVFNLALKYVLRKIDKGNPRAGANCIPDDIVVITKKRNRRKTVRKEIILKEEKGRLI